MRKLFIFALAAAVLAVGFTAGAFASGKSEATGAAQQQTLVYATTDKVSDMDPASAYDFHTGSADVFLD